ncbi:MAG: hypothetical protein JWO60_1283 [Frankiales bacterium]|nr:hypothetical protein [Frankiales bacterium]
MRRTAALLLAGPLAVVVLAGCASSDDDTAASTGSPSSSPSSAPSSAAATDGTTVVTVAEDDGKDALTASVAAGQLVRLELATCGGCGFGWEIDKAPDPDVATREPVAEASTAPTPTASGPRLVGEPTTTSYAFRAGAPGSTTVSVGYHPPTGTKVERTVVLTLEVTGSATALPATEGATTLVTGLYGAQSAGTLLQEATEEQLAASVTPDLADLILIDQVESGGEVGKLDMDPLYAAQDAQVTGLKVAPATLDGRTAVVDVSFTNLGKATKVVAVLEPVSGAWRLSDLRYADGRTLTGILRG